MFLKPTRMINHERYLRIALMAFAIGIAFLYTWAGRYQMNPDGISYLDIADAYQNLDWNNAINAMWSPLYSWILAFVFFLFSPSPFWKFPLAHIVNFFIYLFALLSFDYFLRVLLERHWEHERIPLIILGYFLFLVGTVSFIGLALVTPDMLVAGFAFLNMER